MGFAAGLSNGKKELKERIRLLASDKKKTGMTAAAAYSFLVFNLLCAPCFAAIGAIRREMNNAGWTWFAIGYQCGLAYAVSLIVYQIGSAFTGSLNVIGLIAAIVILAGMVYLLFRPYKEATRLTAKVSVAK